MGWKSNPLQVLSLLAASTIQTSSATTCPSKVLQTFTNRQAAANTDYHFSPCELSLTPSIIQDIVVANIATDPFMAHAWFNNLGAEDRRTSLQTIVYTAYSRFRASAGVQVSLFVSKAQAVDRLLAFLRLLPIDLRAQGLCHIYDAVKAHSDLKTSAVLHLSAFLQQNAGSFRTGCPSAASQIRLYALQGMVNEAVEDFYSSTLSIMEKSGSGYWPMLLTWAKMYPANFDARKFFKNGYSSSVSSESVRLWIQKMGDPTLVLQGFKGLLENMASNTNDYWYSLTVGDLTEYAKTLPSKYSSDVAAAFDVVPYKIRKLFLSAMDNTPCILFNYEHSEQQCLITPAYTCESTTRGKLIQNTCLLQVIHSREGFMLRNLDVGGLQYVYKSSTCSNTLDEKCYQFGPMLHHDDWPQLKWAYFYVRAYNDGEKFAIFNKQHQGVLSLSGYVYSIPRGGLNASITSSKDFWQFKC